MVKKKMSVVSDKTNVKKFSASRSLRTEPFIEFYTDKRLKELLDEDKIDAALAKAARKKAMGNKE